MLKFLTRAGKDEIPGLATVDSAEAFWRALPSGDPIASQVAICDALAEINGPRATEINRLHALFAIERRSQSLLEGLLSEYVSPSSPSADRERKVRQAVLELSRSFAQAYEVLQQAWYTKIKNLKGGILAWADQVDRSMQKY